MSRQEQGSSLDERNQGGAAQRLFHLQQLAVALSKALTAEDVSDVMINEGLATLGGNTSSIAFLSEDESEFITARCSGYSPEIVAAYARYPYHTALPNADVARTGTPLYLETLEERNQRYPHLARNKAAGGRGAMASLPLIVNGRILGGWAFGFAEDRPFSAEDRAFMETIAQICAQAWESARLLDAAHREIVERQAAEQKLEEAHCRQRIFLREVLASVTEGRLALCETNNELPAELTSASPPIPLSAQGGLAELRQATRHAAEAAGIAEAHRHDLVTAVGEASLNAVTHVGSGTGQVFWDAEGCVQVWVVDQGKGIALENLPRATLEKGFTTAGTLGHGMKLILQTADKVYLRTDSSGTTIVIEQGRIPAAPAWR